VPKKTDVSRELLERVIAACEVLDGQPLIPVEVEIEVKPEEWDENDL